MRGAALSLRNGTEAVVAPELILKSRAQRQESCESKTGPGTLRGMRCDLEQLHEPKCIARSVRARALLGEKPGKESTHKSREQLKRLHARPSRHVQPKTKTQTHFWRKDNLAPTLLQVSVYKRV